MIGLGGSNTYTPLPAPPTNPQANTIYCANRTSWDPLARGSGNAYLVMYDGTTYKQVSGP